MCRCGQLSIIQLYLIHRVMIMTFTFYLMVTLLHRDAHLIKGFKIITDFV